MSDLAELRSKAAGCTACELYADATQTVFGSGHPGAAMMLVGEQPGDREDIAGAPFVGPAGRVLDRALERAGVTRTDVYVTNVVKHFRFRREGREGRVRIHRAPGVEHVRACLPWLHAELASVGRTRSCRWWPRSIRPPCCAGPRTAKPRCSTSWSPTLSWVAVP